MDRIHDLVEKQRAFFRTGATLPVKERIRLLKQLRKAVTDNEKLLTDALREDLGRAEAEAYFCDVGSVIMEINEMLHGLRRWARPERHFAGAVCFPALFTKVYKMPYGTVLIISPFNFPILLSLGVLAAALAGGNTAVIKASSKSPACTKALQTVIASAFPEGIAAVIDGGHDVADACLEERFDKIFYTGSPRVAVHVMQKAAEHLTPVALELGGETGNWCIVRADADLRDAARKIAFFKCCNSGQVCININQVAVAKEVAEDFLAELKAAFDRQLGHNPSHNPEYPHLISRAAFDKCAEEAEAYRERIIYGGSRDEASLRFTPTLIYPVDKDEPIVQHELFCPLLPIVPFEDAKVSELLDTIAQREHGLALYLFTKNMRWANRVMSAQQYGGGCINEVCVHMMARGVPFGGTGHSGMGAYHGVWGFREFTHPCTVLKGHTHFNLPLRERPYKDWKLKMIRFFER